MTQVFNSVKDIVSFAKSGAKLAQIASTVLQNNKEEGLTLLKEETVKAALAASLWNSPLKLLTVIDTVKSGKKNALAKQWLKATTELSRELPENKAGDVSRITDETAFVATTNAAIAAWEKSWADFEEAQKIKAEQRASKPVTTPAPAAPAAPAAAEPAPPALFENSKEAADMRDAIADAEERQKAAEIRCATAIRLLKEGKETNKELETRIYELEAELSAVKADNANLNRQLDVALAEIKVLRATNSTPARKRAKTTA